MANAGLTHWSCEVAGDLFRAPQFSKLGLGEGPGRGRNAGAVLTLSGSSCGPNKGKLIFGNANWVVEKNSAKWKEDER